MQSSLLGWGTVLSCLFRYNNTEFSVGMGNDPKNNIKSIRISVLFLACVCGKVIVTRKEKPRLIFVSAVQSCLFRGNNTEFSVGMENGSVLSFSI